MMVLIAVQLVLTVSGFAQADTEPRPQQASVTAARPYVPVRDPQHAIELPANIVVASNFRATVEAMLSSSPTFRRQCMRIGNTPGLTVVVDPQPPLASAQARALTRIVHVGQGRVEATIQIARPEQVSELIAHEFEHVIEQLDGIDLRSKAALAETGVRRCNCGTENTYETARAVFVGLRVASEVRQRGQ